MSNSALDRLLQLYRQEREDHLDDYTPAHSEYWSGLQWENWRATWHAETERRIAEALAPRGGQ